jgi:hypothetical protein
MGRRNEMKRILKKCKILLLATFLLISIVGFSYNQEEKARAENKPVIAQDEGLQLERRAIKFTDPLKPGLLKVEIMRGGITVKGYSGKEVIIEAKVNPMKQLRRERGEEREELEEYAVEELYRHEEEMEKKKRATAGMKKIHSSTTGFEVVEENNIMRVEAESIYNQVDLAIQVPFNTSLKLECMSEGEIKVDGVNGEIEVENMAGPVILSNISGAVVAHSMRDDIIATFTELKLGKPMAFSTMAGHIDITLPQTAKATLKMKTEQGEIYSDFDIKLEQKTEKKEEDTRKRGGKYRLRLESFLQGTINGGGTEIQIETFSGDIYIRKGK